MLRSPLVPKGFRAGIAAMLAVLLGLTFAVGEAQAQLGAIFGDSPPRPPANVPGGNFPPQPPPVQYRGQSTLPPPSSSPSLTQQSTIQAQPLPPPPGAAAAPAVGPKPAVASQPSPVQGPANPPPQPADTSPQPDDTIVTEMPSQKIENSRAVFSGLDKITGRIITFDAAIGETVQFGALQVTARVCYTRPPTEATNTDAFVQVDEVTLQGEVKRIFSGWMFAASPGLHAVEHPIYDVWLTDCASPVKVAEPAVAPTPAARATTRSRQAAPPRSQPAAPAVQPQ
jgi:hypothetical protein